MEYLAERDVLVRCLVRNLPEPRTGVEWTVGDLTEPGDVRAAVEGVDGVFLIWPLLDPKPAEPVVTELAVAGLRVVYLSSAAIDDTTPGQSDPIIQVHAELEALLYGAGVNPIVLRSDTLASNARGWKAQLRDGDVVIGPDVARTPVVDERDVAAAVVTALLAPRHELDQDPYLLTGPESLTRAHQVDRLGTALQRPLRFAPVSADMARARMLADGRSRPLVEALISAAVHRPASDRITDHIERLTGQPAGTFTKWAIDHAAEFH